MISESSQFIKNIRIYEFDEFRLDAENLLLLRNGETVQLPIKAVQILLTLVEANGRVMKKEEILERVWADTFIEESNLTHHVAGLRRALGEEKNSKKFIETVPRRGYRFIAQVTEIENGAAEITINESARARNAEEEEIETDEARLPIENPGVKESTSPETYALPGDLTKKSKRSWHSAALVGGIIIIGLAAIGYGFYKLFNPAPMRFEAKNISRLTSSGRAKLAAISPDGKFLVYSQEETDGKQSLWMRHIGSESNAQLSAPTNIEYQGIDVSPDGNHLYFTDEKGTLFKMPILGGTAKKIADRLYVFPPFTGIGISSDGKQIAFVRFVKNAQAIFIADADGANERKLAFFEQPIRLNPNPAWSRDGKVIACPFLKNGRHNILAVQVADETSASVLPQNWSVVSRMTWLPDSKSLLLIGTRYDNESHSRQIWQISYPSGEARRITNDANNYYSVSLTSDGRSLAAVKTEQTAHIWAMPTDDLASARQLTAGFEKRDGTMGFDWTPDGKIVYDSFQSSKLSIWTMEADGGKPKQAVKDGYISAVSPDGRYVVYQKRTSEDNIGLWRTDLSNGEEKQLTKGADVHPAFSPDGKWVVFTRWGDRVALWKVSIEGGEPIRVFDKSAVNPAISPDGKTIAVAFGEIRLIPFEGGEVIRKFDAKLETNPTSNKRKLQWTADGQGIYFVAFENGASNIWRQPMDGSPPVQITDFKEGRIFNFAFSPDGKQLALSRGTFNSDIVLIENSK